MDDTTQKKEINGLLTLLTLHEHTFNSLVTYKKIYRLYFLIINIIIINTRRPIWPNQKIQAALIFNINHNAIFFM